MQSRESAEWSRHGFIPRIEVFWMISDLTPRKGHFSFSPWQRHGKTVPQKRMCPERAPEHAGSIRKSGFIMVRPLEGGNTPVIIESWYHSNLACLWRMTCSCTLISGNRCALPDASKRRVFARRSLAPPCTGRRASKYRPIAGDAMPEANCGVRNIVPT